MIIDGRALASDVLAHTKARAEALGRTPRVLAIVANETPATKSYLKIKKARAADAGCVLHIQQFDSSVSTASLRDAVLESDADAIVVQLPLPDGVDVHAVCGAIPPEKDADVLGSAARMRFEGGPSKPGKTVNSVDIGGPQILPPVVGAIKVIFDRYQIETRGKRAVVIGAGFLVGAPVATWLGQQGATVTMLTIETEPENRVTALRAADIVVSGVGSPHFIKPEMLTNGVVLIDAGTSELGGKVVGDADPACAAKCSLITPIPGGVGPLAVACLFENVMTLAEKATNI